MRDPRTVVRAILEVTPDLGDDSPFIENLNLNLTRMSHWSPELVNTRDTWFEFALILYQFGPKETDYWYNDVYDIWLDRGSSE
jgi:hypothetical protein